MWNFEDLVELNECRGREVNSPQNAAYLSPGYIGKFIEIIADCNKNHLINALKLRGALAFYSDESSDITSIKQWALDAAFLFKIVACDYFIGLISVSK